MPTLLFNDSQELRERHDSFREFQSTHHLIDYPKSLTQSTTANYTLATVEKALQDKITSQTIRDSERYTLILHWFKRCSLNGVSRTHKGENYVDKQEFLRVLQALNLTVSPEQSNALFDKYNVERDGKLTVHQFLVRSAAPDFSHPWRHKIPPPELTPPGPAQGGPPLRAMTPECDWTIPQTLDFIRNNAYQQSLSVCSFCSTVSTQPRPTL